MGKNKPPTPARPLYRARRLDTREPRPRFLIVCEGTKTEPNYFTGFRISPRVVRVEGIGYNTVSLVQKAVELSAEQTYEQVWCVLDRDDFPKRNFNAALDLARRHGIQVAYSNRAFELWYLLHYDYVNTGVSRAEYQSKLEPKIGRKYVKNSAEMYDLLRDRQETAIRNAARLLASYKAADPAEDDPSTTVHLLVKELLTLRR